jgi:hypothetical protein
MKTLSRILTVLFAGCILMILSGIVSTNDVQADKSPQYDMVQFCKDMYVELGFDNVGECVSFMRTDPVCYCKIIKELQPEWFEETYGNIGQCVADYRPLPTSE